eukprot:jgi/Tetstr1/463587/TSEL_008466.t1
MTALAWCLALFASPCPVVSAVDAYNCDSPVTSTLRMVENLNFVGCFVVLLYFYLSKSVEASRMLREGQSAFDPSAVDKPATSEEQEVDREAQRASTCRDPGQSALPASHWTAAASRDIYRHFSQTIRSARLSVAPFLVSSVVLMAGGHIYALAAGKPLTAANPGQEVCPPGINLCQVTWHCDDILLIFNLGMLLYSMVTLVLVPRLIWSPVTMEAIRQTGDWRLRRLKHLHLHLIFPVTLGMVIVLSYALVDPYQMPNAQHAVFFCNLAAVTYQALLLLWQHHPLNEATVPEPDTRGWSCRLRQFLHGMIRSPHAGIRFQQQTMLVVVTCLFTTRENFEVYASLPAMMAGVWVIRLASVVFFLLIRDEVVGFDKLARTEPAFGLVVDANDLFKAVSHAMRYSRPYPHRLRTYQASLLRMQETMSISYRWQEQQEDIAQGVSINMSVWQLQTLVDSLCQSTCKYVWIDRISVPQQRGYVQETLLSRMMAVYASSGCTLVLRSCEPEGGRYHQRGWTVQEFCTCNKVCILTEPAPGPTSTGSARSMRVSRFRVAVRGFARTPNSEENYFMDLRRWHLARTAQCRPFWLYRTVSNDAIAALGKFFELSERVDTQEPADMIRALIPLLTNCPVETQGELVRVLQLLETKAGMSLQEQLDLFAERAGGYTADTCVRVALHGDREGEEEDGSLGLGLTVMRVPSNTARTRLGWVHGASSQPAIPTVHTATGEAA